MTRKRIGVDFDDVLADNCEELVVYYNQKFGTDFKKSQIKTFGLEDTWGCSREEAIDVCNEFYSFTEGIAPVVGAIQGIIELARDHDLVMITARPETAMEYTNAWIDKHLPNVFKDKYFTNHFKGEKKMTKAEFCRTHNIDVLIDDAMHTAHDVSNAGVPVLLFDQPWNQGEVPELVTRVRSWEEVLKAI